MVVDVELCYGKISEKEIPGQASEARENCYDKLTVFLVETLIEDLRGKCLHVKAILLLLSLTDHVDFAVLKIADSVVNMEIEEYLTDKSLSKDRLLHVLFKQILLVSFCCFFKFYFCEFLASGKMDFATGKTMSV